MAPDIALPARAVAEYLTSREGSRDGVLLPFAKPADSTTAIVIMHNPVRKPMRELLTGGVNEAVLVRIERDIGAHPILSDYDKRWLKASQRAVADIRGLQLDGVFTNTISRKLSLAVSGLRVKTSVDFVADYSHNDPRRKQRRVAVIVNIPGLKVVDDQRRNAWMAAECEIALRTLNEVQEPISDVLYIDLPRRAVALRYRRPSERLWKDIQIVCRSIVRDFPAIRAEALRRVTNKKKSA